MSLRDPPPPLAEPWYYRFLEVAGLLGIGTSVILASAGLCLLPSWITGPDDLATFAIGLKIGALLGAGLVLVIGGALLLLAVDVARHVRSIRDRE